MPIDLFDQLAASEVPPPPTEFERRVHDRLNRALLIQQLADFAVGAVPWVIFHSCGAIWGMIHYTVFGRYPRGPGGN
jgi:hypothetical protein